MITMQEAYIVAYGRSAAAKAKQGALFHERPDDVAAKVLQGVLKRIDGKFNKNMIEDVIVGTAFPEGLQGQNIARTIALRAGLSDTVPGQTVNRYCSSGLQTIAIAANQIMAGQGDILVAGGVELMSAVPMGGNEPTNNPTLQYDDIGASYPMGLTAENVASQFDVSREDQDAYAVRSHQRAYDAQRDGRFKDEIIPIRVNSVEYTNAGPKVHTNIFDQDEFIRPDTTMEALAKLRTVFKADGTVTAGTSAPLSDGAGFVVLMSGDKVKELGVTPIARFVGYKAVGVDPKIMGIGPAYAIPEVLSLSNLSVEDIDLIELNEAFASQTIASIKEVGLDISRTNVNGGAIALGHPLGATGAMLTARLLNEMGRRPDSRYGMVTMCIGVGMGAAAIFEYVR
ncbi:Acetyl-CoA C-acetyltransferase [Staphylococcus aureus subsp. aureus ST228]|jgi:acetyl-CoA acyltransferase|uniref:Probable acetyl-CoA acyltransferase n=15 Tax=Staphylococcus TaxID=1279 RepID=A0A7U7IE66_STAAU|nr:acetyl-CoA C-acetyltransferase [Staphylococcus aureus subsp. aureus USA300_TCH959]EEV71847.1 acetyl-CoA C-acetyltransferase [Staphylococcus aureus A9299]EEV74417.1 acetyl-CoA C-acetyltransferase [Staphylococcus aureus A8115]EFC04200.1 acetyl-CoA acyltransferase [Staphylococcus aureus A8117]EJU82469.1 acetyl-CoA C-acetyltransferase [Staphylococcus aureus subsp. aureus CM05]EMS38951.1 3-ketoacyl-CoA transferase [Staphylococcus aureus KLT6]CCJ10157.1 Acetyl-CoA C-acetyltransferase [Staphyloco